MTPISQDFVLYIFLGGLIAFNYVIKNEKRLREKDEEIKQGNKQEKGKFIPIKIIAVQWDMDLILSSLITYRRFSLKKKKKNLRKIMYYTTRKLVICYELKVANSQQQSSSCHFTVG